MSPEAQRIAIAEALGWEVLTETRSCIDYHRKGIAGVCRVWKDDGSVGGDKFPDYLNDLNAMHEAEKVLGDSQWEEYTDWIIDNIGRANGITSTAAQKAEAFLRTIGKWEDAK